MRLTTFLVLFFAIFSLALATRTMDSDGIQDELTGNFLSRRRSDDSTTSSYHGSSSTENTTTDATTTTAETTTTTETATTTETKKKKKTSTFADPEIFQSGTLFYLGISVTTVLWITGKAIDVQTNRQERYAESLVHSI